MTKKNNKQIKIGLMGASFHSTNMGVSALASASIKCILNRWPNAEVVLLGSGRIPGEHNLTIDNKRISIKIMPIRFSKNIFLCNHYLVLFCCALLFKVFRWDKFKRFCARRNTTLDCIIQMDIVVDITGGDSFSDIYGLRRFVFIFLKKLLPILFDKKSIMLPQTYGPFQSSLARIMARYILRNTDMIFSRDQEGANYVSSLLPDPMTKDKVCVVPDVAFVLDSQKPEEMNIGSLPDVRTDKSVVVGLNVSGLLYYGGYTRNNMFGLREDYGRIICRIINFLMAKKDVIVLLVPHVFPPVESAEIGVVENDVAACLDVYKKFSAKYLARIFMVRGTYDQSEIKYIIGLCDFFLGSRMHSCIAALSQIIPTIGLSYSKKFSGVFGSVEVADQVMDLRAQNMEAISDYIERSFKERDQIAYKLSSSVPNAQKRVLSFLNQIDVD